MTKSEKLERRKLMPPGFKCGHTSLHKASIAGLLVNLRARYVL